MKSVAKNERELWNEKYASGSHASLEPDPFLITAYDEFVGPLYVQPGTAVDVAGGIGRHALWLARRGWQVTIMEVSEVALEQLHRNQRHESLAIKPVIADLSTPAGRKTLVRDTYDLVVVFFYLERKLFPFLVKALKPGGILIYKTYSVEQRRFRGGPTHPLHLLKPNELLRVFRGLRVLHYRETMRDKGVAEFVGVKQR
jgi:SAM-dependent methyltransferase